MLIRQPIEALMRLSDQDKVLASVITASGSDSGTYYKLEGTQFAPAATLGLNADHTPILASLPENLNAPTQRAAADGQQLFIPVPTADGQSVKGFFAVQKLHHRDPAGRRYIIDTVQGGTREQPEFASGHIDLAAKIATRFAAFCGPPELRVSAQLRQQLAQPAKREALYRDLAASMFDYIGLATEQGRHIGRVAPMTGVIIDAINQDTASKSFGHVFIPKKERGVIEALITLHDVGKVQQQPEELKFLPSAPPPGGQQRNYNHPLYSFLILNLPGIEDDALLVADHHQGARKPFNDVPADKRHAFSRIIALGDKLEAMTGQRGSHDRSYTLEEAFAHLTTRVHDDVDPQLVRLLAEQRVDRAISARFPDIKRSRNISRIDQVHHHPLEILQVGIASNIAPMDGMDSICEKIKATIPAREFDMDGKSQRFMFSSRQQGVAHMPGQWLSDLASRLSRGTPAARSLGV